MKPPTFEATFLRAEARREHPWWQWSRSLGLPLLQMSSGGKAETQPEPWEALENLLLLLDDDLWSRLVGSVRGAKIKVQPDAPVQTGDPVVDAWERNLFAKAGK